MRRRTPAINILLTFDYELPLGGVTKSFDDSLFQPTRQLFDFADNMKVPLVFFADILSYVRFREENIKSYSEGFKEQMQFAIGKNHDVQLHIHPHWLDTEITQNEFTPSDHFMLSDFQNNSIHSIDTIITKGYNELTSLCQEVKSNYECTAYRAGGYNLSPCFSEIIKSLIRKGIKYDSSVVPGYYFISAQNKVDFRKVPSKPNWYLSPNSEITKEGSEGLWEVPIASIPKTPFEVPTSFKMKKYAHRSPKARGKMMHSNINMNIKEKFKSLMSNRMLTIDNYTYSSDYLMKILNYNVKRFQKYEEITLALIGHPKTMGDYSFELLESFILNAKRKYGDKVHFKTFNSLTTP